MRVLVPIEDPLFASLLLEFIAGHKWNEATEFFLLHVIEPFLLEKSSSLTFARLLSLSEQEMTRTAGEMLSQAASVLQERLPHCKVRTEVKTGRVLKEVLDIAVTEKAELIIAGSHGRSGFNQLMLGSVSLALVSDAPCPVILVKPDALTLKRWGSIPGNYMAEMDLKTSFAVKSVNSGTRRVVLCVDSRELAEELAGFLGKHRFSSDCAFRIVSAIKPLKLMGIISTPDTEKMKEGLFEERLALLASLQAKLTEQLPGSEVDFELVEDDAKRLILKKARDWDADLIVIGSRGPGQNQKQSIGSVALHVLAAAPCSVMFLQERAGTAELGFNAALAEMHK